MFNRLEQDLRRQGKGDLADAVKALHKLNGGDIPLPGKEGAEISRFSVEQRKGLERKGYLVYQLTGQTIASLREAGHPFLSTWHKGESLEKVASLHTEVAINLNKLFLPKSNGKPLDEQLAMVETFSKKIGNDVPGTAAILGTVADYAEVAFAHFTAKGQRLFGKDFNYDYTRTTTPTNESGVARVGDFNDYRGLHLDDRPLAEGLNRVWAAPLVVPAAAVGR